MLALTDILTKLTSIAESPLLTTLHKKSLKKNIFGKGENAGDQHFLLFPQCFLIFSKQMSIFSYI